MELLSDRAFQYIGIPLIMAAIAQGFHVLGKRSKIEATDFSGLPYSLGIASLAINAAFVIASTSDQEINVFYYWSFVLILGMVSISILQRFLPFRTLITNILCILIGIGAVSATFFIWR